ncbi:MAG: ATP cone domain-containing protein, partial [Planctomycetota bacterium]
MIGRISKVRKRDGRLVDFDESKIADAIYKAACAVGGDDRLLAEELAGVVTLFLEKQHAGRVPHIEEIQDMVEKVLIETGHARTAKAYILYRDRRARARDRVEVRAEGGGGAAGPLVGNAAKALVSPWTKSRIAAALVREADLPDAVAEEVASRVEQKVLASRVARVSTSVIRSLVEAELFLMGHGDRVGRQALVGLPRFDVDALLRGAKGSAWRPGGPRDLRNALAGALLAQYAMSEVYSAEVVEAHLDARIHVVDAGCPFEWVAAAAEAEPAEDADAWVEGAAHL